MHEASRESRLRSRARSQGLILRKARTRTEEVPEWGTYALSDAAMNTLEVGDINTGYGLTLDQVEEALREDNG